MDMMYEHDRATAVLHRDLARIAYGAKRSLSYILMLCSFLAPVSEANPANSRSPEQGHTNIVVQMENDIFAVGNSDRWYSSGLKLKWATNRSAAPAWLTRLAAWVPPFDGGQWWGWSLQQVISTPRDITDPEPPQTTGLTQDG
jgi:hypothetical protein